MIMMMMMTKMITMTMTMTYVYDDSTNDYVLNEHTNLNAAK